MATINFYSHLLGEKFVVDSVQEKVIFDSGTTYTFQEIESTKDISQDVRRRMYEIKKTFSDSEIDYIRVLETFEKSLAAKTIEEVYSDVNQAESWLVSHHNHKRFEDVFAKFCISLRVYGKKNQANQLSLFDVCKKQKGGE